jgi:cysteine-rich repeat protein
MTRPALHLGLLLLLSCSMSSSDRTSLALRDPQGIVEDATELRLVAFPTQSAECRGEGTVEPAPPDDFDAPVPEAVANVGIGLPDARAEVTLDRGNYILLVQARGDDPFSGRRDTIIGTGCTEATVEPGVTRMVRVALQPVVVEGTCGDDILSGDEQCDDGNVEPGDGCSNTCQTEPQVISVARGGADGAQSRPALGWAPGARLVAAYDSDTPAPGDVRFRLLGESGQPLDQAAFEVDSVVAAIRGVQSSASVGVGGGRAAIAFADFVDATTEGGDVRVRFFDLSTGAASPSGEGASVLVTSDSRDAQIAPAVATIAAGTDAGATLVAFEDGGSATGLSARVFPAGSIDPTGSPTLALAGDLTGAHHPVATATDEGFIVAFTADEDVYFQHVMHDGTAGPVRRVLDAGMAAGAQDQPTVAFLPASEGEGRILVAFRDQGPEGDGDGSAIRGRLFDRSGQATTAPFLVNTTIAGDQGRPAAVARRGEIGDRILGRFAVSWEHAGGAIRGRLFEADGDPALNRQPSPSTADFRIAGDGAARPTAGAGGPSAASLWGVAWERDGEIFLRVFPLP